MSNIHPSRQAFVEEGSDDDDKDMGVELANIPIDHDHDMSTPVVGMPSEKASAIMSQFERKRRAAAIAVPTDDTRVRARLRELKEPITLFGEGPAERRDRLREHLTSLQEAVDELHDEEMRDASGDEDEEAAQEEFYTLGSDSLLQARKQIARYSLARAQRRIAYQKDEATIPLKSHLTHREALKTNLETFELFGSQVAGDRPVSLARFAPNNQLIAAGNWGGAIRILDVPNLDQKHLLRGHTSQVGGLAWHPTATLETPDDSPSGTLALASAGGDATVHLWSLAQDTPIATLSGHIGRVCRTEFHPSGEYLASAGYDTTWRLWDVRTTTELLLQEGHSKEVYTVAFNPDGSLVASAGLDSVARVWDLRSGRSVMVLDSHVKPIYALDWAVDAHRLLTGSGDGFAKCWDVRNIRETASIASHTGGVTDIQWFRGATAAQHLEPLKPDGDGSFLPKSAGSFFVSCGFDKKIKVFAADTWEPVRTLSGHTGNVLSVDVSGDGKWVASSGHDRTVKLWGRDEVVPDEDGEGGKMEE